MDLRLKNMQNVYSCLENGQLSNKAVRDRAERYSV